MALVKCKECGKEISSQAPACPSCGVFRFAPPKKTSGCAIAAAVLLGVPFLAAVFVSSNRPSTAPSAPASAPPSPTLTPAAQAEAMEAVKKRFIAEGGAWKVSTKPDAMSGRENVFLNMPAAQYGKDKFGRNVEATLIVQCSNNQTGVAVSLSDFISNQPVPVASRIDSAKARTQNWSISTDYQGVFAPNAIALLKELAKAETFTVRLTPHGESPMDFQFTVTGLQVHLPKVQKACGW